MVGPLALAVQHLDGGPVDIQRIGAVAQRQVRAPTLKRGGALGAVEDRLAMLIQFDAIEIFDDGPVRRWLAGQDDVAFTEPDRFGDWQTGKQIVAEKNRRA